MPQTLNCPYCLELDYFQQGRIHEVNGVRSVEFWCLWCGRRHTRKDGVEDAVFAFFPEDIERAFNHDSNVEIIPLKGVDGDEKP
jgi:hypothetical protein